MSEIVLNCDTVIIGAGSAGIEAYKAALASGVRCILVECGPLGTSARRTGDTPIAYLLAAAKKCHGLLEFEDFGVSTNFNYGIDTDHVLNTLRATRAKDTGEVLSFIYRIPENSRLIGRAQFIDDHTIMVNESHTVKFHTAVIATGSAPVMPYELSQHCAQGGVYTTNDFFEIDHLPNSMAIFGSNREGLQIGQALSYLGVKVMVFGNHQIWELTDESVISVAVDAFNDRFDFVRDCYITAIERAEHGFSIYYLDSTNYENHISVDTILSASVRYPKLDGLNVRSMGLNFDRQGCISVNELTMQSSVPHIFAAGEVTNLSMTTDHARKSGAIAGLNAAKYPKLETCEPQIRFNVLGTDPELAMVGLTYEEVKLRAKAGNSFVSGEIRCSDGLFRTTHAEGGILRIYCDEKTHLLLGAEMCMHEASRVAYLLAGAIKQNLTIEQIVQMPYFSPSYEEIVRKVCEIAIKNITRKALGAQLTR